MKTRVNWRAVMSNGSDYAYEVTKGPSMQAGNVTKLLAQLHEQAERVQELAVALDQRLATGLRGTGPRPAGATGAGDRDRSAGSPLGQQLVTVGAKLHDVELHLRDVLDRIDL
jgi:hypothetical protein